MKRIPWFAIASLALALLQPHPAYGQGTITLSATAGEGTIEGSGTLTIDSGWFRGSELIQMIAVADDGGDGQTVIATTQTSPWSGSMSDLPAVNFTVYATVKLRKFADPSVAVTIASAPAQVKVGGTKKISDAGKLNWDKGYPQGGKLLITGKGTYELLNSDWEIVGKIKIVAYVTGGGSTPGPNEIDPVPDKMNPLKGTWGPVQISAVPGTYTVIAEMRLENAKLKSKTVINTKVITSVTVTAP